MGLYAFARYRHRSVLLYGCVPFVLYMIVIDIPMYDNRHRHFSGNSCLTFVQGWRDASHCKILSQSFELWFPEMLWMTPYFTFFVWVAIYMADSLTAQRAADRFGKK
jgi:hypothetical protein